MGAIHAFRKFILKGDMRISGKLSRYFILFLMTAGAMPGRKNQAKHSFAPALLRRHLLIEFIT